MIVGQLSDRAVRTAVRRALDEDLAHGDVTTEATVRQGTVGGASLVARVPMVVCGLPVMEEVFAQVDPRVSVTRLRDEGARTDGGGETIARIEGPLRSILTGERVSLNFLQRMSGIATRTAMFTDLLGDRPTRLVDTRDRKSVV